MKINLLGGVDLFTWRTRVVPALLATAPAILLGVMSATLFPSSMRLWGAISAGIATGLTLVASLVARRAGHRIEPALFELWGGTPTTAALRHSGNTPKVEILRRHTQVARVLGKDWKLPSARREAEDPVAADREYEAAVARLRGVMRGRPETALLQVENVNYGFARNLYGLKQFAQTIAVVVAALSILVLFVAQRLDAVGAWALFPFTGACLALLLWRRVDIEYVHPAASAYAGRFIEALYKLPEIG